MFILPLSVMQATRTLQRRRLVRHKVTFGPLPSTFKPATELDPKPRKAEPWVPLDRTEHGHISAEKAADALRQLNQRHEWVIANGLQQ